jgi:hypothetical protein
MKKILHIASFEGNIGDNASHLGFLAIIDEIGFKCEIKKNRNKKSL